MKRRLWPVEMTGALPPNRDEKGEIAGATGTGKTVTLQILAEGFSNAGALGGILSI